MEIRISLPYPRDVLTGLPLGGLERPIGEARWQVRWTCCAILLLFRRLFGYAGTIRINAVADELPWSFVDVPSTVAELVRVLEVWIAEERPVVPVPPVPLMR